jgi:hypothetical protein
MRPSARRSRRNRIDDRPRRATTGAARPGMDNEVKGGADAPRQPPLTGAVHRPRVPTHPPHRSASSVPRAAHEGSRLRQTLGGRWAPYSRSCGASAVGAARSGPASQRVPPRAAGRAPRWRQAPGAVAVDATRRQPLAAVHGGARLPCRCPALGSGHGPGALAQGQARPTRFRLSARARSVCSRSVLVRHRDCHLAGGG